MRFDAPEQLFKWHDGVTKAYSPNRERLACKIGTDMCYYEGCQWITTNSPLLTMTTLGRRLVSWNPDTNKLRVTANRTTKNIIGAAAATFPDSIQVDVYPGERAAGVGESRAAKLKEAATNSVIEACGYTSVRRDANHMRSVCGAYGVGLSIESKMVGMPGGDQVASSLRTFSFEPTRLTLDPAVRERDLRRHDWVVYSEPWTVEKIERDLGVKLDERALKTMGKLLPAERAISELSNRLVFGEMDSFSETKAAMVHQVHIKDESGRFGQYFIIVEAKREGFSEPKFCPNFDNPVTPFGGCGLPFAMIYSHRRAVGIFGISDVSMLKDDQDKVNLITTLAFRIIQRYAAWKHIIDKTWYGGSGVNDDDIRNNLTNQVGGVIIGKPQQPGKSAAPYLMEYPPPPPILPTLVSNAEESMREGTFRTEGNYGLGAKSHVPFQTTDRLLREADRVAGIRVKEDIDADEALLEVMLGTTIKLAAAQSPPVLRTLYESGFDERDFGEFASFDSEYTACRIKVRESSIRYRSYEEKKAELRVAGDAELITPAQERMSLASDLDSPLTQSDAAMATEINKAVDDLLTTGEWEPLPLGEYNAWMLAELRQALFDPRTKRNPDLKAKVIAAIQMQQEVAAQDAMLEDPEAMAAAQAAQPQPEEQLQQPQTVGELMSTL